MTLIRKKKTTCEGLLITVAEKGLPTSDFRLRTSDFRLSYNKVVHPIDKERNKLNSKRGRESNENNACEKFE